MASDVPGADPAIIELLDTVLPDEASETERADFVRGLTLLAELLGEIEAGADAIGLSGEQR